MAGHEASRLLRWVIWLATLFFVAMLFVPLVREALRRATQFPPGHF
jgi:preprotein translocase subunit SecG